MFRRMMNVLSRNRKSKINSDNVKTEYATLDMEHNVRSSTHAILNTTVNDASGVYETINSTVQDIRYSSAVNGRHNAADSASLSGLTNTACDGSKSEISDAFWSGMLKIQSNFQEAAQIYEDLLSPTGISEDLLSPTGISDDTRSNTENSSIEMNHYSSLPGEDSESVMSLAFSLPIDINTSDVSITDEGLEHSNFDKVSLEYIVTLNLLQTEKEFAHHLAALQKFRQVLTRVLSKEQEAIMFQNMNELGVISEVCADELRVILNASHRSNDSGSEPQLTVEDIYDACFPEFREEHDAYIHGLDKALTLCKELHRSTPLFSDVMTEQQFELLTYLLASPTYHPKNIATALREVLKAITQSENLEESKLDDNINAHISDIDEEDMIVCFNSTLVQTDPDNADNTHLLPKNPDNTYLLPIIPYDTYPDKIISKNAHISSMDQYTSYLLPVYKAETHLSPICFENIFHSEVEQDSTYWSTVDSDNMRLSPVGQETSFMSYVDPEVITRRQFLSHYQQQGMSADMSAMRADEVDRVSRFRRGYIMTASRRDYVRNRFRSADVFVTLVEDM